MKPLQTLLESNRAWAAGITAAQPEFFSTLSKQQAPQYLWIGCSDSRVPANQIVGLAPGELFVHRNVANLVIQTDLNLLSVLQYAVDVLRVQHVIVCGHFGCGGVRAAYRNEPLGLIDNWLRAIKDVYQLHRAELEALPDEDARVHRLCALNVLAQARHVAQTTVVQDCWRRGQDLTIHAWVYAIENGILHDLGKPIGGPEQVAPIYRQAAEG